MGTKVCSRRGASEGARLCPSFRLRFGAVVFELTRDGRVRLVMPACEAREFDDLAAFVSAMRTKGGA